MGEVAGELLGDNNLTEDEVSMSSEDKSTKLLGSITIDAQRFAKSGRKGWRFYRVAVTQTVSQARLVWEGGGQLVNLRWDSGMNLFTSF